MAKKIAALFALSIVTAFAQGVSRPEDVANLFAANSERVSTFTANFVQRVDGTVLRGEMKYKKGGKFRFTYLTPVSEVRGANGRYQEVVCNGETLWTYIPRSRMIAEQTLSKRASTSTRLIADYNFSFFSTNERVPVALNTYRAEDLGRNAGADESYLAKDERLAYHMLLRPKPGKARTDKAGFSSLHLWVDAQGTPLRALGVSTSGAVVEYVLTDVKQNVEIPDADFNFVIPQGEQVIRNPFVTDGQ